MSQMTPREIVEELDKHIVGQKAAKRAVAIALRNRWRRGQVAESLRAEITPKNILMIGPTGVGKTEIARRLARLAKAPFIKVEATKFTEVGYVGREVDSIVRDLVEISVKMTREEEMAKVRHRAADAAEDRILDALLPRAQAGFVSDNAPRDTDTRQRFRKMLREHELDDREIEIELRVDAHGCRDHGAAGHGRDDPAAARHVPEPGRRQDPLAQAQDPRGAEASRRRGSREDDQRRGAEAARGRATPSRTASSSSTRSTRSPAARRPPVRTSRARACSAICCRWSRAAPSTPSTARSRPITCCSSPRAPFTCPSPRISFPSCRAACPYASSSSRSRWRISCGF